VAGGGGRGRTLPGSHIPDVPFIVVSGKVGEDAAVEIMKAGADDYLTKENTSRLCPAIQRELREVEVKRERGLALSRSEDRFKRLVEQAADAPYSCTTSKVASST
jgi:sigma-B regulation protein RsbU (phosphoserine phosphatase)